MVLGYLNLIKAKTDIHTVCLILCVYSGFPSHVLVFVSFPLDMRETWAPKLVYSESQFNWVTKTLVINIILKSKVLTASIMNWINFKSNFYLSVLAVFQLSVDVHKYIRLPTYTGLWWGNCTALVKCWEKQVCVVLSVCVLPEGRAVYRRAACGRKVWHVCVSEKITSSMLQ